jgi:predicted RNA-binding Zn ribbon-like protein
MENANTFSLGSAAYGAKRATDILSILQNNDRLDTAALVSRLNQTLKKYGEKNGVTPADLDELIIVSDRLHAVFAAPDTKTTATLLNALLSEYAVAPRLSMHGNSPWHLHVDNDDHAPWAEWFVTSSALVLAILLSEKQRNPGGLCASPICEQPFIDLGKGGGRDYCSPRCATRERVAAYRKRDQHS